jgi:adhesin/invasin
VLLVLPTGVALADTGPASSVSFDTEDQTKTIGESVTVTVTVTDDSDNPVSGKKVTFEVTGANTISGSNTSGVDGKASYTYTGHKAGEDTIKASIETDDPAGSSATITIDWELDAEKDITLSPSDATSIVGSLQTMTATVTDSSKKAVQNVDVTFTTSGANEGSAKRTTNNNGVATFSYTGMNAGTDTVTATVNDGNVGTVMDVASVQWVQPRIKL